MMNTSVNNEPAISPSLKQSLFISSALHLALLAIALLISDSAIDDLKMKDAITTADELRDLSVVIASEDAGRALAERGTGPHGLNDDAGRELVECARSGISVTPDNFLDYAKIRELRKGRVVKPQKDVFRKYPFLTGRGRFEFGSGHKLKSDYREYYEDVCRIIDLPIDKKKLPDDEADDFTAAVAGYLDGARAVRSWRTLWMSRKPPATKDKIELVRLLRRLHAYHLEGDDAGHEHMRAGLASIMRIIPEELIYPAPRAR